MDIYTKKVLEHYKNPKNRGQLKTKTKSSLGLNPSCGDSITIDADIKNNRIHDITFSGDGCAISIASASMLTDKVKGMKITEIAELDFNFIQDMLGIKVHSSRKKCAMLPLNVLKKLILSTLIKQTK